MSDTLEQIVGYLSKHEAVACVFLGGSRTKGYATPKSDYDLFVLINDADFQMYSDQFVGLLERMPLIDIAAYHDYVENWGYIYKAMGCRNGIRDCFDITILPQRRSDEMALRSTNKILYDRNGIAARLLRRYSDRVYETSELEQERRLDYVKMFGFEHLRFQKSMESGDYWLAIKAIERMRTYYLHYRRIKEEKYATNPHSPEKGFADQFPNEPLWDIYCVRGNAAQLSETERILFQLFYKMVEEIHILDYFL